jgi:type VI secretion system protein ImpK
MSPNLERRAENLAFAFQELLTVGERLRANRQAVSDAESFRHQLREAIKASDMEARKRGYNVDDIKLATQAAVAFLDESILNLRSPIFADWPRRPMQEEMYGHHVMGEIFFQDLQKILGRNDSQDTADLLEVYYLCMLLGFAGRYSIQGRGDLRAIMDATGARIKRIRQMSPELSPWGLLPKEHVKAAGADPWVKRLLYGAVGCLALVLVLFTVYKLSLGSRVSTAEQIAAQSRT